jgi:threonylcarbamoyladenosine tRNA methylthiotransferase MtaB
MFRFLEGLPAAYLHVFTCSIRPGTVLSRQVAGKERTPVPHAEAATRASRLSELGGRMERSFASSFLGSELQVLFEESSVNGDGTLRWSGYSGNYLRVDVDVAAGVDPDLMRGSIHNVHVEALGEDLQLHGRLLF